jgi:hypothetical protein
MMDIAFNAPDAVATVMDTTPRVGITHEEAVQLAEFTRMMWMDYERYGALRRLLSRVDAYLAKESA